MPEGATLVNTARKEVIDEEGLKRCFRSEMISDISRTSLPIAGKSLKSSIQDRIFFTPKKMGAQTAEANLNAGVAAARQIVNFLEKGDTTFKVN